MRKMSDMTTCNIFIYLFFKEFLPYNKRSAIFIFMPLARRLYKGNKIYDTNNDIRSDSEMSNDEESIIKRPLLRSFDK